MPPIIEHGESIYRAHPDRGEKHVQPRPVYSMHPSTTIWCSSQTYSSFNWNARSVRNESNRRDQRLTVCMEHTIGTESGIPMAPWQILSEHNSVDIDGDHDEIQLATPTGV